MNYPIHKPSDNVDTSAELAYAAAVEALSTPPPPVDTAFASQVAQEVFGFTGPVQTLSGERDRNFLIGALGSKRAVLKFISSAEPSIETDFQIAVLHHMASREGGALTPRPIYDRKGQPVSVVRDKNNAPLTVRAYTYLEGRSATQVASSPELRRSLGHELATFDAALAGFSHPGTARVLLWDLMQLGQLRQFTSFIIEPTLQHFAIGFIDAFTKTITPALRHLRAQIIHNDLSKSNFLVDDADAGKIAGILDFGDMSYAPLIVDLAIAASYQMADTPDPMSALDQVVEGFDSVLPLSSPERAALLDLVIARLVQRLVITEWRAAQFPENAKYILRHNPEAHKLLHQLIPIWQLTSRHASTFSSSAT